MIERLGAHAPRVEFTIAVLGPVAAVWLTLSVSTAIGARHRGQDLLPALVSGVAFPLTWLVWYVNDNSRARGSDRVGVP